MLNPITEKIRKMASRTKRVAVTPLKLFTHKSKRHIYK